MSQAWILTPLLPLWGLSLLSLGSHSWPAAGFQAAAIVIGLLLYFTLSAYPFDQHRWLARNYFLAVIILLLLPFIFGTVTRGAVRWIPIGSLTLQPSELIKPLLIIIFSAYLTRSQNLKGYLLLLLIPFGLIIMQPDLGTGLVIGAVWFGLLLASRINRQHILVLLTILIIGLPFAYRELHPYQQERLQTFLNPYHDPTDSGYQVIQAMIAVGSGGFSGQGLGNGSQSQLKFLPERQTDFIFASMSEEMGFIAAAGLVLAFWWLLKKLLKTARATTDEFGRLLVIGVTVMIYFQTIVTIGMNLGLLPVTGITLPFVSGGGSSIIASMVSLGLAGSVWKFSHSGL